MSILDSLKTSCKDILYKNLEYTNEQVYLLYDEESPLSRYISEAYKAILPETAIVRKFENPPQPLYRGGFINPDNPYNSSQNKVVTAHNINENIKIWLDHHTQSNVQKEEDLIQEIASETDRKAEIIKNELISLPVGSIVILVQSTNFRLSTFRIRLELFHRWVHVIEHNHLAYIPDNQFETFARSLEYRTPEYTSLEASFASMLENAKTIEIISPLWNNLSFWSVEKIRGNTGNYTNVINKWGTFPIGEVFTEARDLDSVNGTCLVDTFPNLDFSIEVVEPFELVIKDWRVLRSENFPEKFQRLYDLIVQFEWEVRVRELGFGLNPAISTTTPLKDINFHERKLWIHLSLWKKHGIYGKKLPKTELQRFHIDVFLDIEKVCIDGKNIYQDNCWKFS